MTAELKTAPARFDAQHSAATAIKDFFDASGYVIVENVFDENELAPVRARLEEIIADPSRAPAGVKVGRENDTLADGAPGDSTANPVRNIGSLVRYDPLFQAFAPAKNIENHARFDWPAHPRISRPGAAKTARRTG